MPTKFGLIFILLIIYFHPIVYAGAQNPKTVLNNEIFNQWQNKAISFTPAVTDVSQGSSSVVVAIIDSGVDFNHYDLGTQLKYKNGWNFVNNSANTAPVPQHIDSNNNGLYDEAVSHGTEIAGIIAGQGKDVLGIVPKIKILDIKIYDSNGGSYNVLQAFNYVYNLSLVDHHIKVINFSGSISGSNLGAFNNTFSELLKNNVSIVSISGNNYNEGIYNVSYPGNYPGVISVGAINKNLQVASFSQRGTNLDFVAPGENVFSLAINNQIDNNIDGTSIAAPFYTGAVAFLYSLNFKVPLTPERVFSILKQSVTDLGPSGWDPTYGYGLLNMTKMIQIVKPLLNEPEPSLPIFILILPIAIFFIIKINKSQFKEKK